MNPHMNVEIAGLGEALVADGALEWPMFQVDAVDVNAQMLSALE